MLTNISCLIFKYSVIFIWSCYISGLQTHENETIVSRSREIVNEERKVKKCTNENLVDVKLLNDTLLKIIIKLLEENHQGSYITCSHTSIRMHKSVQSFIPNLFQQSALHIQNAQLNNYKKYILPSYNECPYFQKLLKCVKVCYFGERKKILSKWINYVSLEFYIYIY